MTLDVPAIRAAYPALADGYAYLDGADGRHVERHGCGSSLGHVC